MPLIVFEGPEGSGKTTQLRLLSEWIVAKGGGGRSVVAVREPGGTLLGDEIRRLLLDPASDITGRAEALLFMASRAQLVEREVRPALDAGAVVLVDRYFLSTYAYQVEGRGLPQDDVAAANRFATGGLRPDVTLLMSFPVSEGLARAARRTSGHDRMEQETREFHERVARAFDGFTTAEWQAAHPEAGPVESIDARGAPKEVFARVLGALRPRWPDIFPSA